MSYKYIPASVAASESRGTAPKDEYIGLFQQTLNEQFYNASNWWTILEEDSVGSATYTNIDVRLTHVINAETGLKLGDDWKTILFKDTSHTIVLGLLYVFDGNTWLTTNSEIWKNLTATCTIRRCNNTLRWIDEATGAYYQEPCAIEYEVKEPRNYSTSGSAVITPGGFLHIQAQLNERTGKIKENQRFLFGNSQHWTCYKVVGTGLNDFRNTQTYNNDTANILTLDLVADYVNNQLDDVVNGIADVYTNLYTITLNKATAEGSIGDTVQLIASVTYNGNSTERNITWTTSDEQVATVDTNGLVSLLSLGTCTITANIEGNSVSTTCGITVSSTPVANTEVIITPSTNYILEGSQRIYSVYFYEDDIQQADTFTITCIPNDVPAANYSFVQVDGNHFMVSNKIKSLTSYLTINCVSTPISRTFNIYLRGAW